MTEENLAEKEQIKILRYYISELSKYIEETAAILDINTSTTILGKNCIEYWALLSSASNNAIKKLQQENKALKQSQEDAEKVLKNILDNFDIENHYRNAINEIEKHIKKYEPTRDDEFALIEKYKTLSDILVIINKVKGERND